MPLGGVNTANHVLFARRLSKALCHGETTGTIRPGREPHWHQATTEAIGTHKVHFLISLAWVVWAWQWTGCIAITLGGYNTCLVQFFICWYLQCFLTQSWKTLQQWASSSAPFKSKTKSKTAIGWNWTRSPCSSPKKDSQNCVVGPLTLLACTVPW